MKWTNKEKKELRRQVASGLLLPDIRIKGRGFFSIRYMAMKLSLFTKCWKRKELYFLKEEIKKGKNLGQISITGRTEIAIRDMAIRKGYWKTKKRKIYVWSMKEVNELKHLVFDCGYTVNKLISGGYFTHRTKDSIQQQLRRINKGMVK